MSGENLAYLVKKQSDEKLEKSGDYKISIS